LLLLPACQRTPFGEVLMVVNTNVPVPRLVSHLRIDLFRTDGTWFESRDAAAFRPDDWPVSFGVATTTTTSTSPAATTCRASSSISLRGPTSS
jgi:hypothetical protein